MSAVTVTVICSGVRCRLRSARPHSHKDAEQRELRLVRLQEVHEEADGPRQAFEQAADAGDGERTRLKLLSEDELCKPEGMEEQRGDGCGIKVNYTFLKRRRHINLQCQDVLQL